MTPFRKKRFLVLIDRERVEYLRQVFAGRDWVRIVDLDDEEFPTPPGQRLVSDAAWEVLKAGAKIPLQQLKDAVQAMGTMYLADHQREPGEKWTLAELHRRSLGETEGFEE